MTKRDFTGISEDMYAVNEEQYQNNEGFIVCAQENNIISLLFWPNYAAAPWHLQAIVGEKLINFWPHKMKAHVAYESQVNHGIQAVFETVRRVQSEKIEDFDIVEDFQ